MFEFIRSLFFFLGGGRGRLRVNLKAKSCWLPGTDFRIELTQEILGVAAMETQGDHVDSCRRATISE